MSGFSSFVLAFCTVCITVGALQIICPSGSLSKSVKFALSLAFICCLLSGVAGIKFPDIQTYLNSPKAVANDDMSQSAIRLVFEDALSRGGINFSKVTVCTDKLDDGSISIIEVVVYSPDSPQKIEEVIGGGEYEVRVIDERKD